MYLWQKNNGYFFQIRIPANRVSDLGSAPIRIWLGALSKREAKRQALLMAGIAFGGFKSGMDRDTLKHSLKALTDEIASLKHQELGVKLTFGSAAGKYEELVERRESGEEISESLFVEQREKLATTRARIKTLSSLHGRLEAIGQALSLDAAALTSERAAYAHALQAVTSLRAPVPVAVPQTAQISAPAPAIDIDERTITADTLLSVAGKTILDIRKQAKEGSGEGDDRYQERLATTLAAFIDIIGDKPLSYYLPMHIQDFATVMAKIPKNRAKYLFFKDLSLKEIAQSNAKRKEPIPVLTSSSVTSSIGEFLNLWTRATAGVSGVRDLKSYRVTMPATARKSVVREGLPALSLNVWLEDAFAINTVRYEYKKYMLLVGLLTGMRLGEIVYLQPKDIVEYEGHTVIDLRQPIILRGKTTDRALKTETSPRIVALHPYLHECGFINWAQRRKDWVFGECHRAGDPADGASKQMSNWMRRLKIHDPYRQVFHSLRHNAKHWLRTGSSKLIADKQCGHSSESVADSYGFTYLQADEIGIIENLELPKVPFFQNR